MQGNKEYGESHINHEDFDILSRHGMVADEEIPGIGEVEKVVIFDEINNSRSEIITRPQVVYSGIGKTRKAVTVFVPDRKVIEDLKRS
ncbi:MAG: hypothetical protein HYT08_00180 [Candidatus Levybacteria bacterium]|nr:hypothetical protein [Candidatus Levybacteria bacterium]